MILALFDLDHTLLSGDSDALWCEFLMDERHLDRALFEARNREVANRYRDGAIGTAEFCAFYVATLAGRSAQEWQPLRQRFLREVVAPRIPAAAQGLVERHRALGHRLVLTTATNRFITELTAAHLGIADLIATEVQTVDGRFSGRTDGTPNMREGKVERLRAWLRGEGLAASLLAEAHFYSDSINDLPLLREVAHPVAVDPDPRLRAHAQAAGWPVIELAR